MLSGWMKFEKLRRVSIFTGGSVTFNIVVAPSFVEIMILDDDKKNNKQTRWPSGLRRNVKAVVFISVGSNPTRVNLLLFCLMDIL